MELDKQKTIDEALHSDEGIEQIAKACASYLPPEQRETRYEIGIPLI